MAFEPWIPLGYSRKRMPPEGYGRLTAKGVLILRRYEMEEAGNRGARQAVSVERTERRIGLTGPPPERWPGKVVPGRQTGPHGVLYHVPLGRVLRDLELDPRACAGDYELKVQERTLIVGPFRLGGPEAVPRQMVTAELVGRIEAAAARATLRTRGRLEQIAELAGCSVEEVRAVRREQRLRKRWLPRKR